MTGAGDGKETDKDRQIGKERETTPARLFTTFRSRSKPRFGWGR